MIRTVLIGLVTVLMLFIISCVYNKKELPEPDMNSANQVVITYTNHTKRIIDEKCANCHSSTPDPEDSFNPPLLTSYSEVEKRKTRIQVRALDQGTMPTTSSSKGPLTQAEKDTLQMWLDQGALE